MKAHKYNIDRPHFGNHQPKSANRLLSDDSRDAFTSVFDCKVTLNDVLSERAVKIPKVLQNGPDKPHSACATHTEVAYLQSIEIKPPISWPDSKDSRWEELDSLVAREFLPIGSISDRIASLESLIYTIGVSLFGLRKPKSKNLKGFSRRTKLSIALVCEKNSLISQVESCMCPLHKEGLLQLLSVTRAKLRSFRKSEKSRIRRKKYKEAQLSFKKNPYLAGRSLLDPKVSAFLKVSKSELNQYKLSVLADDLYSTNLGSLPDLPPNPPLLKEFHSHALSLEDFSNVLSSRRNSSAPGINGIIYRVYKLCPQISSFLYRIFCSCVKNCVVPVQWRVAKEVYIPKSKEPDESKISDFRPIALLNVEGKLFFRLISKRIEDHVIHDNKFINTSIQKGCMEKVPGCWEHMSLLWSGLKDARKNKKSLSSVWLDIANAYGSIPHRLIFFALERYGIPPSWINIVKAYYKGLFTKSFSVSCPSDWHQHFKGIFAGCTISIILFLLGMNVVIEFTLAGSPKSYCIGSTALPPIRAFMDDLNILSPSISETKRLLMRCTIALKWAGMKLRPDKSRSVVIVKGRCMDSTPFVSGEISIPSIQSMPVKFLGRVIDGSLSDRKAIEELDSKIIKGLNFIDKSCFTSSQKLWILQNLLVPRIQWPLLIYEIPVSHVAKLESKISVFMRKWLKLHHSTSSLCFYSKLSPCPLPVKSLSSILKSSKISGHLLLRDSSDPVVSSINPNLKSGRWRVGENVRATEMEIQFRKISGYSPDFGIKSPNIDLDSKKGTHSYRRMVSQVSKDIDEESNLVKALSLQIQGSWLSWGRYIKNNLSWKDILATPPDLLSFCLKATYGVLPSPSNLRRWKISSQPSCTLCGTNLCSAAHILAGCKVALKQGRFTYRHDEVLVHLVTVLKSFKSNLTPVPSLPVTNSIDFVPEGKPKRNRTSVNCGVFFSASDWIIKADLSQSFTFPLFIAATSLRPDIVCYSKSLKRVVLIELTCPCEENFEDRHQYKSAKYQSLVNKIQENGWTVDFFAIEVGLRGYCSSSVVFCLRKLGLPSKLSHKTAKALGWTSLSASFVIWLARDSKEWADPPKTSPSVEQVKAKSRISLPASKPFKQSSSIPAATSRVGFVNKGNTCYANAILQALSTLPSLWSQWASECDRVSPLVRSIVSNLSLISKSKTSLDPSNFLRALQTNMVKTDPTFNFNAQHDSAEILNSILDELTGNSPAANEIFKVTTQTETCCDNCLCSSSSEEYSNYLSIPIRESLSKSLQDRFKESSVSKHCPICEDITSHTISPSLFSCGTVLILHLNRFSYNNGRPIRNEAIVDCLLRQDGYVLTVHTSPSANDSVCEVHFNTHYSVTATINHSGTLDNGHYTAHVKDMNSGRWFHCNDKAVVPRKDFTINNSTSYIIFFVRK